MVIEDTISRTASLEAFFHGFQNNRGKERFFKMIKRCIIYLNSADSHQVDDRMIEDISTQHNKITGMMRTAICYPHIILQWN